MPTDIAVQRIDPEAHIDELVALARVEYGDSEIANPDYLRWQYLDNPAGKAVVVVARGNGGNLAGQYVVLPMMFRLDSKLVKGSLSLNTLTHPEYRGRGLFTKMANETYAICEREGLGLTLGFPNKNSYPGFVRKLQFRHIGNATVLFKILNPLKLLKSLPTVRSAGKYGISSVDADAPSMANSQKNTFEIRELTFDRNPEGYDSMIGEQADPRLAVYKHAEFCRWRFESIPTRKYRAFQAANASGVKASCVIRLRRVKGVECAFVVDLQLATGESGIDGGRCLLKGVLSGYRKAGVALGGMMVNPGSREYEVARSVWFREMPSRFLPHDAPIIVRRNGKIVDESVFDVESWAFSFGDYDVF